MKTVTRFRGIWELDPLIFLGTARAQANMDATMKAHRSVTFAMCVFFSAIFHWEHFSLALFFSLRGPWVHGQII